MRQRRVTGVFVVMMIGLGVIFFRVFDLQVSGHEIWAQESRRTTMHFDTLPFARGWILDRRGVPLAMSQQVRNLDFRFRTWRLQTVVGQLAQAQWLWDGERPNLHEFHTHLEGALLAMGGRTLDQLASVEPRLRKADLEAYLGWVFGDELLQELYRGIEDGEGDRRLADFPHWGKGISAALKRGEVEAASLARLAEELGGTSSALVTVMEQAIGKIDRRVVRVAAKDLLEAEGKFLSSMEWEEPPELPDPEASEGLAVWRLANERATVFNGETVAPWFSDIFKRERRLHLSFDEDPSLVLDGVPYDAAVLVELRQETLSGFEVSQRTRRVYPDRWADVASTLIGRVGKPSQEDMRRSINDRVELSDLASLEELTASELARYEMLRLRTREINYAFEEERGVLGLEQAFENVLRGKRGWVAGVASEDGISREEERAVPEKGLNLTLTLDVRLQEAAEAVLDRQPWPGAVVLLKPNTGEILAMATGPRPTRRQLGEEYSSLLGDSAQPLSLRGLGAGNLPPPGSTFKPVAALAGLSEGVINARTTLVCDGRLLPDERGAKTLGCLGVHGPITVDEALIRSCNIFFYQVAERVGGEHLARYADDFGFGHPLDLVRGNDILHSHGIRPGPGLKEWVRPFEVPVSLSDTMRFGIGQAPLDDVTPVRVASVFGSIGVGYVKPPTLILGIEQPGLLPHSEGQDLPVSRVALDQVRQALREVVDHPRGTARALATELRRGRVADLGLTVAGKTGTPEVANRPDHSWFAGYFPADNPQIAFAVFLEHTGKHGGEACVEPFVQLLDHPLFRDYWSRERRP